MKSEEPLLLEPDAFDWPRLAERYAWIRAFAGCPQDPIHHAEGDVFVHTRMVVEALFALSAWRQLPPEQRAVLYASALLHDVAKPACTVVEADGRVTSAGHAKKGERMARALLAEAAPYASFAVTEAVCKLVRFHGLPLWLFDKADPRRAAIEASLVVDTERLALLAEADARGRVCADQDDLLYRIDLFREFCRENHCYGAPYPFAGDHSRFLYFRKPGTSPEYAAYDDTAFEVTLMCGLPGAGKDTWLRDHCAGMPVVSLDALRKELGAEPTGNQGAVIQAARQQAREHLRARRPFVWNATNLSRQTRGPLVDLFFDYGARTRIVYLHTPLPRLLEQNRRRDGNAVVPEATIRRMLDRLEVPDATEAHRVEVVEAAAERGQGSAG